MSEKVYFITKCLIEGEVALNISAKHSWNLSLNASSHSPQNDKALSFDLPLQLLHAERITNMKFVVS